MNNKLKNWLSNGYFYNGHTTWRVGGIFFVNKKDLWQSGNCIFFFYVPVYSLLLSYINHANDAVYNVHAVFTLLWTLKVFVTKISIRIFNHISYRKSVYFFVWNLLLILFFSINHTFLPEFKYPLHISQIYSKIPFLHTYWKCGKWLVTQSSWYIDRPDNDKLYSPIRTHYTF